VLRFPATRYRSLYVVTPAWCKRRWCFPHSQWQILRLYLIVLQVMSNAIFLIERERANNFLKPVCTQNF
jgi:hypothetical protein